MSGGGTISNSATKIEALQLQSSAYGVVFPIVGGVTRVAGNLIDYVDFKAIPHTSNQGSGGKGGGTKTTNTTYEYLASVIMAVHAGVASSIRRVWVGKEVYDGGWSGASLITVVEPWTPTTGNLSYTIAHASTLFGEPVVYTQGYPAQLRNGTDYTRSGGTITLKAGTVWALAPTPLYVRYSYGTGTPDLTALQQLGITYLNGSESQQPPAWMTAAHADRALSYRGLGIVHAQDYSLGTGAQVENHLFEVIGPGAYRYSSTQPDCNPWEFVNDLLSNADYGAAISPTLIDVSDAVQYVGAAGILMSPALTEQTTAADLISRMCELTNCGAVWSYDRLKIRSYADASITGNGLTYTANTTPLYDIDDDVMICGDNEDPVEWSAKTPTDRYNVIRLEYMDRSNAYAKAICEVSDDADIAANGRRVKDTISAHWICDLSVANLVGQIFKERSLNVVGEGKFTLPWAYGLIEPMDLLNLLDQGLFGGKLPVRIKEVEEDEDGYLSVTVEDWPLGTSSPTAYTAQVPAGFQHDRNEDPGSVSTPVFFEAPVELTGTGLQVWCTTSGVSDKWGGCDVYVSLDGNNYKQVGTINGAGRYGSLATTLGPSGTSVGVQGFAQQLLSGSAADAQALTTLLYIGGGSPEFLAYQNATLTGAGTYTLSGLVRGAYSTASGSHSVNDRVIRCDDTVAKSDDMTLDFIGKIIYFKFLSFNRYGGGRQGLADVSAYTYAIAGTNARIACPSVTGPAAAVVEGGVRISWDAANFGRYSETEVRLGSWASGTRQFKGRANGWTWLKPAQGSYTLYIKHLDWLGNESAAATALSLTVDANGQVQWTSIAGTPAMDENLLWNGSGLLGTAGYSWSSGTVVAVDATSVWTSIGVAAQYAVVIGSRDVGFGNKFPVSNGEVYALRGSAIHSGGGTGYAASLGMVFYDAAGTQVLAQPCINLPASSAYVANQSGTITVPTGAASAIIWYHVTDTVSGDFNAALGRQIYWTGCSVKRVSTTIDIGNGAATDVYTYGYVSSINVTDSTKVAEIVVGPYNFNAQIEVTATFSATVVPTGSVRAWLQAWFDSYTGGTSSLYNTPYITDGASSANGFTMSATYDYFAGNTHWIRLWCDGQGGISNASISGLTMRATVVKR